MLHVVKLYKSEVVARLCEEAMLTDKPFGPFMAELFPEDVDAEHDRATYTGIIIPQITDGDGGVRKLDPAHTAIPLRHLLNLTRQAVAEVFGYTLTDEDARTAARGRIEATLVRGIRYPDGRVYEFIYE